MESAPLDQTFAVNQQKRTLSPEHKAKLSEKLRGRKLSPEHKAKLSEKLRGRKRKEVGISMGGELVVFTAQEEVGKSVVGTPEDLTAWPAEYSPDPEKLERRGMWSEIFNPTVPAETVQPKRGRGRPRKHNLPVLPANRHVHKLGDVEPKVKILSRNEQDEVIKTAIECTYEGESSRWTMINYIAAKFDTNYKTVFKILEGAGI